MTNLRGVLEAVVGMIYGFFYRHALPRPRRSTVLDMVDPPETAPELQPEQVLEHLARTGGQRYDQIERARSRRRHPGRHS